jgi:hypothetical protein
MTTKKISGCWDLQGRIRCETGGRGEEPRVEAAAGDRVYVVGEDVEFTVEKVETKPARPDNNAYVWYTPVEGSVVARPQRLTPDSSEEQLAREQGHGSA